MAGPSLAILLGCFLLLPLASAQCSHGDHNHGHDHEQVYGVEELDHDHDHAHPGHEFPQSHAAYGISDDHHDHDYDHDHGHDHDHGYGHEASHNTKSKSKGVKGAEKEQRGGGSVLRQPEEMAEERELLEHGFGMEESDKEPDHLIHGLSMTGIWVRAMGSSLLVSLASLICLSLLPFITVHGKMPSRAIVDALAAFGVGAMLGDSFFHQLPHAFGSGSGHSHDEGDSHSDHSHAHSQSHSHSHADTHSHSHSESSPAPHAHSIQDLSVGISILFGILLFFIVEKIVRKVEKLNSEGKLVSFGGHSHSHSHSHSHGRKGHSHAHEKGESEKEGENGSVEKEGEEGEQSVEESKVQEEAVKEERDVTEEEKGEEEREEERARGEEEVKKGEGEGEDWEIMAVEKGQNAMQEEEGEGEDIELRDFLKSNESTLRRRGRKATQEGEEKAREAEKDEKDNATVEEQDEKITGKDKTEEIKSSLELSESKEEKVESVGKSVTASLMILGYLNLFSDGVHNFTDGMALGAAFLHHGTVGGWSRMLFMLAHELPQEVGDFGILVRSGFSVGRALFFNFLSALMAMAGTAMALAFGGNTGHSSLIEGFTAGGFIYICVAGVIPDMHTQDDLVATLTQLLSMVVGMSVALVISLLE